MHSPERLHSLDAIRASALLLGVALHAAQPFINGLPWITTEQPDLALEGIWYTIHLFRMPLFFLMAGLFGRLMLERRGTVEFVSDRARRILIPLLAGVPLVLLLVGLAVTGAVVLQGGTPGGATAMRPPASPGHHSWLGSINLMHLWFLYYLIIFYALALTARVIARSLQGRLRFARLGQIVARSAWGPALFAAPTVAYYAHLDGWSPWGGLPAPFSLVPDPGALIGYGSFFAFGWLLHGNCVDLRVLQGRWRLYSLMAIVLWTLCRALAGSHPHWGPFLHGPALIVYVSSYVAGSWCSTLGLISLSSRFVKTASRPVRYLADSSYWIYLVHLPVLFFFQLLVHPMNFSPVVKYGVTFGSSMGVLLVSYHLFVRFTFVGRLLNGPRAAVSDTQQPPRTSPFRNAPDPLSVASDIQ